MKKYLIGAVIAILIIAIIAGNIFLNKDSKNSFAVQRGKVFNVKVKKIENGSISSIVTVNGEVVAVNSADVYFNAPLKVKKIKVQVRQKVKKGDKLVDLDLSEINANIPGNDKQIKMIKDSELSPIDGVITEINIKEGMYTNNMTPAFKIVDIDNLNVKAYLKQADLKNVKVGQSVKIYGDAISKEDNITGKVLSIAPVATKIMTAAGQETVIEALISVEKLNSIIRPGLNVTCDILTANKTGVPIVSMDMLMEDKDGNQYVFVVDEKGKAMYKRNIKLGIISDFEAEVISGLKAGDLVVVDPQPNYTDGAGVNIINTEKEEVKK
ncbi:MULTISPECIES: efflux RND transporter periplasmic adaptor subunit [Thermoanaerobacter]|uniref:Multidrug efflux pump subunit AcrA (Membrane-fusion protein) n=1 Tax=Thermoanaerobacter pentosaceus TaxID=694059 RepID=A0ABT9M179_9THEO|nr:MULTISPECIES: HlyD family efflux transporter periplasmic adaptor subunit [Thermoanaerobacter]MDP9749866.1 multidrug efflux pump subunit AcrA (membrane-fusion protein) [Thermoanaerobacter pentosaceus]